MRPPHPLGVYYTDQKDNKDPLIIFLYENNLLSRIGK